jgi:hypothetical protein
MSNEPPVYIDPKLIYAETQDSWKEYWDEEVSPYENLSNIVSQSVILPRHHIQLPIATTYLFIPSKWAKVLPVLFSYGQKGSGKSTFATIGCKLHGQESTFSPKDTFAAIRNELNRQRWIDPEEKTMELDGAILCWDNIHAETLERDIGIYQLLLFGYSRASERIMIAGKEGVNRYYQVFCPKVISSIEPLHTFPQFEELWRRFLIIEHKPWEKFTTADKDGLSDDFDINQDRLDLDSIDWTEFSSVFHQIWNDHGNCYQYAKYRNALTHKGKKAIKIPKIITGARWTISIDLICTGLVVGTWSKPQEAVDHMASYWEWYDKHIEHNQSATVQHLQDFIEQEAGSQLNAIALAEKAGLPAPFEPIINASKLKQFLVVKQELGELDITPRTKDINMLMGQLGWKLSRKGWTRI